MCFCTAVRQVTNANYRILNARSVVLSWDPIAPGTQVDGSDVLGFKINWRTFGDPVGKTVILFEESTQHELTDILGE